MAINLVTKYADKLAAAYTHESFLAGKTSKEWKWDGAHTIDILSIVTQNLADYNRSATSNRYGTPAELEDTKQEISVAKDKSFSIVIDAGNNTQQMMLKKAGEVMKAEVAEKVVPEIDKYALAMYAANCASLGNMITGYTTITKANVIEALTAVETYFADRFVPNDNRYVFLPNAQVALFRQALTNCDTITDKLLLKGIVGDFGTLHIVGIPTAWMPSNTNMLAFQSKSVVLPEQIKSAIVHENPQGFNGNVLEGRYLFDAGIVKAHKDGIVVVRSHATNLPAATESAVSGYFTSGNVCS